MAFLVRLNFILLELEEVVDIEKDFRQSETGLA